MKQRNKKKLAPPRATKVNEILRSKKGGSHQAKTGDRAHRARQKANARREMDV